MLWFTVISLATSIASNALIMKIPMACNEYQIHSRKSFTFENSLADWLSFSFAIVWLLTAYHILDFVYRNSPVLAIGAYTYGFGCWYIGVIVSRDFIFSDSSNCNKYWLNVLFLSLVVIYLCVIGFVIMKQALYQLYHKICVIWSNKLKPYPYATSYFLQNMSKWINISVSQTHCLWKLRKFTVTLFLQNFRESDAFT